MKRPSILFLFILPIVCIANNQQQDTNTITTCDSYNKHCVRIDVHTYGPLQPPGCRANYCAELIAFVSENGGNIWHGASIYQATEYINNISSISCSDNGMNCSAVGAFTPTDSPRYLPLMLYTMNGGYSWLNGVYERPDIFYTGLSLVACDKNGIKCAAVGTIQANEIQPLGYYTQDGGKTWDKSDCFIPPNVRGRYHFEKLECNRETMNCIASGKEYDTEQRFKYQSKNGGISWKIIN